MTALSPKITRRAFTEYCRNYRGDFMSYLQANTKSVEQANADWMRSLGRDGIYVILEYMARVRNLSVVLPSINTGKTLRSAEGVYVDGCWNLGAVITATVKISRDGQVIGPFVVANDTIFIEKIPLEPISQEDKLRLDIK